MMNGKPLAIWRTVWQHMVPSIAHQLIPVQRFAERISVLGSEHRGMLVVWIQCDM